MHLFSSLRPEFTIEIESVETPAEVWRRLWDLDRHTSAVPLTVVSQIGGHELRLGARFVARTQLGPMGLDDVMVVREWEPPRTARIEKVGRLLTGDIRVHVEANGSGSRVLWQQTFGARGVPEWLAALGRLPVWVGYRASVRKIINHEASTQAG